MSYIEQFESELAAKLNGGEDTVRIPINSDTDSKIFGQHSGIFGQLSERSDALCG